jgi:hypothetical protein
MGLELLKPFPRAWRSMARGALVSAAAAILVLPLPAFAQTLRVVPLEDWRYMVIDALLLRNPDLSGEVWLSNRPWRERDLNAVVEAFRVEPSASEDALERGWVDALGEASRLDPDSLDSDPIETFHQIGGRFLGFRSTDDASFEPPFEEPTFRADEGEPSFRGILQHDFAVQYRENFSLGWRYLVDSNIRNAPARRSMRGIRGEESAFEVVDAYAIGVLGPLTLTVGRVETAWGPGRASNVFLSESIPSLDQFRLELEADPVRFTAVIAQLSRERPNRLIDADGNTISGSMPSDSAPVPFDVTRFLYLHRLDWRVRNDLQVAISEGALVTGIDRGIELRFANPLIPFYVTQKEDDETDEEDINIVANVEVTYTGLESTRLYADLFVQEFFIDAAKRRDIGNQLAWRVGGMSGDPLGWQGTTVGAEYTRVDVFTYLHRGLNTNWTTFGVPLGSSLGPDADQGVVWADIWVVPTAKIGLDLLVRRGGERNVRTLESVLVARNPKFPSGIVQREWRIDVEAHGFHPRWGLEGRARLGRRWVDNIANELGRDGAFWELRVDLAYRWRPGR